MTPIKQYEKSRQEAESLLFKTIKQESNNLKKPGGFLTTSIDANANTIAQEALQAYRADKKGLKKFNTESRIEIVASRLAAEKIQLLEPLITQKKQELNESDEVKGLLSITTPHLRTKELWEKDLKMLEGNLKTAIQEKIVPCIKTTLEKEIASENQCTVS